MRRRAPHSLHTSSYQNERRYYSCKESESEATDSVARRKTWVLGLLQAAGLLRRDVRVESAVDRAAGGLVTATTTIMADFADLCV